MSDPAIARAAPPTEGALMRVTPVRRAGPWLIGLAILIPLPWLAINEYQHYLLNVIGINIILAVGLNIVKGFAGQITVGHIALAAIGAYSSAVLSVKFGLPFWLALPGAVVITGLAGIIVGIPAFRLEGAYLALATLGLAESVRIFISATAYLGAAIGFGDIPPPYLGNEPLNTYAEYYYLVMPLALAGTYFSFAILRSDIGRAFQALREDSIAAAATGVNVRKYKLLAFLISALYAGCAGSLAAHLAPGFIHPNNYTIGHIWGGVIGAILVTIIYDLTRDYYQYQLIIFGMIIVLTVSYMPKGIGGLIDRYIATRRFIAIRKAKTDAP
jgi:branched-chain amino acid transport system permease protein